MLRSITIDGKSIAFKATAGTVFRYGEMFGGDFFKDMQAILDSNNQLTAQSLKIFYQIAFTMAKQADSSIPDDPWEWLDEFEVFPINEVFPFVIDLWQKSNTTISELQAKNAVSRQ